MIKIKKLKVVPDERGRLGEILRNDDPMFKAFGQVYFTTVYPGVVKAWHEHNKQTDNLCCIVGDIKLVLDDTRNQMHEITEIFMGEHNPILVQIPPMIRHGFKNIGLKEAIIVNISDIPYNYNSPDENRFNPHNKHYDWGRKDG